MAYKDDYLVTFNSKGYGIFTVALIVRADSTEEADEKARQHITYFERDGILSVKAEKLDEILSNPDDVIEIVRVTE